MEAAAAVALGVFISQARVSSSTSGNKSSDDLMAPTPAGEGLREDEAGVVVVEEEGGADGPTPEADPEADQADQADQADADADADALLGVDMWRPSNII